MQRPVSRQSEVLPELEQSLGSQESLTLSFKRQRSSEAGIDGSMIAALLRSSPLQAGVRSKPL